MTMQLRRNDYFVVTAIIIMYFFIGHLFDIDILKLMTIYKDGFSVSFLGIAICYISIVLACFTIRKLKK
ncbi:MULTISPECIES: hypothetical protein [Bacillus cereus group]|uniref:Uncharacterized protein n=1 Tax=Bacillus proteolyticus TaxID=2026192 RepID=A0AA44KRG9_9BACI|nr:MULTISPECIES: hypothetical protein [Bacillus cereus group]MBJ8103639.1 hypothetical protein [Bacillus cereus group sp. N8]OJE37631.1 hypothetical protein BAQ49_14735 [Bacillus proteolyticus]PGV65291.1 hypothetical protein COD94_09640 [Bacillus cereus]